MSRSDRFNFVLKLISPKKIPQDLYIIIYPIIYHFDIFYISLIYLYDIPRIMANLLHIRVGKGLKKKMGILIDKGLFSNQAELIREGLREVLIKYKEDLKEEKIEKRKQKK